MTKPQWITEIWILLQSPSTMAFIPLHDAAFSADLGVQPNAGWPPALRRDAALNGGFRGSFGGTSTAASHLALRALAGHTPESSHLKLVEVFDLTNHAPNSPDPQRGSIVCAGDACTADSWRRWITLWELATMEMSTPELARLTELHFQGAIYHLRKEPPAPTTRVRCGGAHFFPLIIPTDTRAVMDTPTREGPAVQRDDCLPRIRSFMNKKAAVWRVKAVQLLVLQTSSSLRLSSLQCVCYPGNGTCREQ